MAAENETVVADQSIRTTRIFNAPRELVFKVWTDQQHIAQWWGPTGFTTTTEKMEVNAGGVWRFCMHGPDGRDYENQIKYLEVVSPERLVYEQVGDKEVEPVKFHVTVTFEDMGDKTRINMQIQFQSQAALDHVIKEYGAVEGLKQTLQRLGEHLADGASPFIISRRFAAPRELVFKAWTERDRLMHWFGPKGFKMVVANMDLRPGGSFHYCLKSANGGEMWGKFIYREIVPPERIVWVNTFSDEQGNLTRHPAAPGWPREMLTTVTFVEHNGKTTVTLRSRAINASPEETHLFDSNHPSMTGGWTGTFDQLKAYLETAEA